MAVHQRSKIFQLNGLVRIAQIVQVFLPIPQVNGCDAARDIVCIALVALLKLALVGKAVDVNISGEEAFSLVTVLIAVRVFGQFHVVQAGAEGQVILRRVVNGELEIGVFAVAFAPTVWHGSCNAITLGHWAVRQHGR